MGNRSTVGDYVSLQRGITYKGKLVGEPGPALLGLGSISPGGGFREADYKTYGGECPDNIMLVPGDLFASLKGATKDGEMIGSVAKLPESVKTGRLTQDTVKLEFHDPNERNRDFLYWVLRTPQYRAYCGGRATGSAVVALSRDDFLNFPVPEITSERLQVVDLLETIHNKIELNRRMNATLEGMAQALFKSWFVDFDPVIDNALAAGNPIPEELAPRAKVRRQALANGTANRDLSAVALAKEEAAKPFPAAFQQTESMGWIPEGWEVRPLAEEVQLTMGQSPSSDHYNTKGEGLPFHQGVTNYGTRFPKHNQFSTGGNRYAEDGDVLFSVRAPVGRINIANCKLIIGRGLAALRHKKDYQGFLVYFLKHTFATEDSIGSGTIFNAVNKTEMERISLIVPPDKTTRAFDEIANSLDEMIASNAEQTDTLTKLRDTLLPKLISGDLRVSEAKQFANTI